MRHLQLGALIADDRPVLRPVELERFARLERQRHEGPAPVVCISRCRSAFHSRAKAATPIIGTLIAEAHQIGMQLLHRPLLLAGLLGFRLQPGRQPVGKRIKLARPLRNLELRLDAIGTQIFADGVPRQAGPAAISRIDKCSRKCQRRITLNNAMSITPSPRSKHEGQGSNMGQFSMEISQPQTGSVLSGNQQGVEFVHQRVGHER
jgi:hypothetical protein